ncbi:MAG: hypothetical protein ACE5FO_03450 [Parvularculaceae bacterium]
MSRLANDSNLVLRGRVAKVEYKMSEPDADGEGALPHTIVTYEIRDVLRGKSPGETFTMRFIGGPDGMGRFLDVSGVPKFEEGDRDLLFIAGNGEQGCPLVLCEWGRYRILRGGVYNAKGAPVRAVRQNNAVSRGRTPREFMSFHYPAPAFDDLMRHPEVQDLIKEQNLSVKELRQRYEREAPKRIEVFTDFSQHSNEKDAAKDVRVRPKLRRRLERTPVKPVKPIEPQPAEPRLKLQERATTIARPDARIAAIPTTPDDLPEGPMAIEEFVNHVKSQIAKVDRRPVTIRSIDPGASFRVAPARQNGPQAVEASRVDMQQMTPEDRAEFEALQKQNFDPVMKRR